MKPNISISQLVSAAREVAPGKGGTAVGRVVAKLRYQQGWTQELLAAKMQVKGCDVGKGTIANIEGGRSLPTYGQIKALSRVFKVPVALFFPADDRIRAKGSDEPPAV